MQVQIVTQNHPLGDWNREHLQNRLRRSLARFVHRIESVTVSFEDVNGPRGGIDIQCRIRLLMFPRGEINVSAVGKSAYLAMHNAIQRAKRRLRRAAPDRSRDAAHYNLHSLKLGL